MNPKLLEEYRAFGTKGIALEQAKISLSSAGWTNEEIEEVIAQNTYRPIEVNNNGDVTIQGSDQALMKVGKLMLDEERAERRDVAIADGLASEYAPGIEAKLVYKNKFYDDIGMSWSIPICTVIIALLLAYIHASVIIIEIVLTAGTSGAAGYYFYQNLMKHK